MSTQTYVWDPLVRIFHWTLVLAFVIAYFTGEEENALHIYSGYYILGLVAFRVLWGFIGTQYARFSHFSFSKAAVKRYLLSLLGIGESEKYLGHNPAGSWMVIVMLVSLLLTGVSGLLVYGAEGYGPFAQTANSVITATSNQPGKFIKVSDSENNKAQSNNKFWEEFWEEIHEFFANFTVLLVLLHIAGVGISSIKHGQNLVRAMITGYKQ